MKGILILAAVISMGGSVANAGPSSSGGGAALVCRDDNNKIASAELLDLYEARVTYGLKLVASTGSTEEDYYLAADRTYTLQGQPNLAKHERANILEGLKRLYDLAQMTGTLPKLNDLGRVPDVPEGCAIEQLAIFDDAPNKIRIDSEIWSALDTLNRAALATHEAHYYFERTLKERTSESTRAYVAHIYAENFASPVNEGIPPEAFSCSSLDPRSQTVVASGPGWTSSTFTRTSSFKVFPWMTPSGPGARLQFTHLSGRPIIKKTTIEIPNVAFAVKPAWSPKIQAMVLVVAETNQNQRLDIPLRGGLRSNTSIEVHYVTGEPVRLVVKENGVAVSEEVMTGGCSN